VFVDADVLFAGAAAPSEHGASLVVLRMAEIPLIEAVAAMMKTASQLGLTCRTQKPWGCICRMYKPWYTPMERG
jgi:hypothetical protein